MESILNDAFHFVRLTLHLQSPFSLLPDVGEGEASRLLVELHRLVLLHAARRFHPFHIQRLPVVEVRHLPVAELFPRQAFHQAVQRVDAVLVMGCGIYESYGFDYKQLSSIERGMSLATWRMKCSSAGQL